MNFLKMKATNLMFSMSGYFQTDALTLELPSPKIYLLGEEIPAANNQVAQHQAQNRVDDIRGGIAWFSYRSELSPIEGSTLRGDTGWGCMIRAGQMLLFVTISRLSSVKSKEPNKILEEFFRETGQLGPFSLQRFVETASRVLKKPPGEWFRSTTFLISLRKILKGMKAFEKFRVVNVLDNIIYWKKLYKAAFIDPSRLESKEEVVSALLSSRWDREVLFTVSSIFGLDSPSELYTDFITKFAKLPCFVGLLGGQESRAYYFPGLNQNNFFYYLDPHYCVPARSDFSDQKSVKEEYFQAKYKQIHLSGMSPSMTLCFLFKSEEDFKKFFDCYTAMERESGQDFILCDMMHPSELENSELVVKNF